MIARSTTLAAYLSTLCCTQVAAKAMVPITRTDGATFTEHYVTYMRSPAVVVVFCVLVGPLLYGLIKKILEPDLSLDPRKYDIYRLGLLKRSNLDDQHERPSAEPLDSPKPRVKALFTYPVKSCRGVELAASEVGQTGLKYDRMFTFAQLVSSPIEAKASKEKVSPVSDQWKHEWRFITQREFPRLALLETELWVRSRKNRLKISEDRRKTSWAANGGCVVIRFPFEPGFNLFGLRTARVTIRVPLSPTPERVRSRRYTRETLSIWKDQASAINVTNEIRPEALEKLKYFLGVSNPLAIFRVDDNSRRSVSRSLPKDRGDQTYSVGFSDAFPLHLLSLSSAQKIADEASKKPKAKGRIDARRFRANIYLDGVPAYDEDTWKKVRIGRCISRSSDSEKIVETEGEYHVACRTARCTLPNVDQESGIRDADEPYTTLGQMRKVDKGAYPHPCLGMQMIPMFSQGMLKVGDEVSIAETGEHCYEKMFA